MPSNSSSSENLALANLRRAVALPWKDDGRCVVAAAALPWPDLVERCFHVLDRQKIRFHDVQHRCPVASADAATVQAMVGFCLLAQPELVVGAVVVVTAFVVAVAIVQTIDAYELSHQGDATRKKPMPSPVVKPVLGRAPDPSPEPRPSPLGPDIIPPWPDSTERRPECKPIPVPHRGGDELHNECADRFPPNVYPGMDVLVNGKRFDALQVGMRVLWEIKTDRFETYTPFLKNKVVDEQVIELRREHDLAIACGYDFVVGVSSAVHRAALLDREPELKIVVTGC